MNSISAFQVSRLPKLIFGPGKIQFLPEVACGYGSNVLLVTGGSSLSADGRKESIIHSLTKAGLKIVNISISEEPGPEFVDATIAEFGKKDIDVVAAIGGGSVLDAGKAISAMLPLNESVIYYLEGMGDKKHNGIKKPFIAIPTTSGTGSEATKNAVLSRVGKNGFKKSIRHENFVPDIALIDPELTLSCSPEISAACGMDAFAQLLESFVSKNASPFTDALAWNGLEFIIRSLPDTVKTDANNMRVRSDLAYAAYLSGITLANAGLGVVHGMASSLGGHIRLPHGLICGTLTAAAAKINIKKLNESGDANNSTLMKYGRLGVLLTNSLETDSFANAENFVKIIEDWTNLLKMPALGKFGLQETDLKVIVEKSSLKENPVDLSPEEMMQILKMRL